MPRDIVAAGRAISAEMAKQRLTNKALAAKAGITTDTLRDLRRGDRWSQDDKRGAIEAALGWPYGYIEDIAEGRVRPPGEDPPAVGTEGSAGDEDDAIRDIARIARELADAAERLQASRGAKPVGGA